MDRQKNGTKMHHCFPATFPRSQNPRLRKTIVIKPVEAFSESTTYHIEINTSLNDLHGNSIGTPFHFFFSTGATIDSGKVVGCVSSSDLKGLQQPKVALFALGAAPPPDTLLFGRPATSCRPTAPAVLFSTISAKAAPKSWPLPTRKATTGLFREKDAAFGPEEKTYTLDSVIGPVSLYPVKCDTAADRIASIKPLSNRVPDGFMDAKRRHRRGVLFSGVAHRRARREIKGAIV